MKKKTIVFILLISLLTLLFVGCSDRLGAKVAQISIKPNSFKASYEIDERLNYDNIFILVTYLNGETEYIKCEFGMIEGFNTSTTGTKQLNVEYKGVKSEAINYEVIYSVDNSKEILTSARIEYVTAATNEILGYGINYYCGDLINVNAILFSLYGEQSLKINSDFSNLSFEMPRGWSYYVTASSEQTLRVLFYNKDNAAGLNTNTSFIINVNKGNPFAIVKLKDIEVSTLGEIPTKYYLPDFVR